MSEVPGSETEVIGLAEEDAMGRGGLDGTTWGLREGVSVAAGCFLLCGVRVRCNSARELACIG